MAFNDTRIVEMRFDNKKFDRNIAKSKKSLEDFKEELNFEETAKGLEKFSSSANSLDFDNLSTNIEKLTNKFTGLGTASEWVLSRMRHYFEGVALKIESFVKSFSIEQMYSGNAKYDALTRSVQTIVATGQASEEAAYEVMNRVMVYTDQTSHSYETMVNKISSLTATGMGLTDAERLIEGIGNASTMAGASASDAAIAMEVLTKAISLGHLGQQQFISLSNTAKVVTADWRKQAIEAAIATGDLVKQGDKVLTAKKYGKQIEVTEKNLESTLHKKWLTEKALIKLYEQYEFGKDIDELEHPDTVKEETLAKKAYLTGQRALTLADAVNAVKESISGKWVETFLKIFGKLEEAAKFFTSLCEGIIDVIGRIGDTRNKILGEWEYAGGRKSFFAFILGSYAEDAEEGAYGLLDVLSSIGDLISQGFWDFISLFAGGEAEYNWDKEGYKEAWLGVQLKNFTESIRDSIKNIKTFFNEDIQIGNKTTTRLEIIRNVVKGIAAIIAISVRAINGVIHFFTRLKEKLQPSIDAVAYMLGSLGKLIFGEAKQMKKSDPFITFFDNLLDVLTPFTNAINKVVISITNLIIKFIEWGKSSGFFSTIISSITSFFHIVGSLVSKFSSPILGFFSDIGNILSYLFEHGFNKASFEKAGEMLKEAIHNLFNGLLDSVGSSVKMVFSAVKNFFVNNFGGITDVIGASSEVLKFIAGLFANVNLYRILLLFLGVATIFTFLRLLQKASRAVQAIKLFFSDVGGSLVHGMTGQWEYMATRALNIAKAIGILTACVILLGTLDTNVLLKGVIALGVITGILFLASKLMEKSMADSSFLGGNSITFAIKIAALAAAITVIALSVAVLALALVPLSSSPEKMATAVLGLTGILAAIAGFMFVMKKVKVVSGNITKSLGMVAMIYTVSFLAKSIGELAIQLTAFALVGWGGTARMITGLAGILLVIAGFMKLISTFKVKSVQVTGLAMLAIGLGLLVFALLPLAVVSWEGMAKMGVGLTGLLLTLVGFMKLIKLLKIKSSTIYGLTGLAIGIGLLVFALLPLTIVSWEGMAKMGVGLIGILTIIAVFCKAVTKFSAYNAKMYGLIGLVAGIAILVFALLPLTAVSWEGLAKMGVGLIGILAIIAVFAKAITKFSAYNAKMYGLIGLVAGIAILVFALLPLTIVSWEGLGKMGAGLVMILLAIFGFCKIMNKESSDLKKCLGLLGIVIIISVLLTSFSMALSDVKDVKWEVILAFSAGLSVMLLAVSAAILLLKDVPLGGSLKAIAIIAAALAAIAAVISYVLPILARAIGTAMLTIASRLSLLAEMLDEFTEKIKAIDEDGIEKGKRILDSFKEIVISMVGMGKYRSDVNEMTNMLYDIATTLESYTKHTKDIPNPKNSNAIKTIEEIAKLQATMEAFSIGNFDQELFDLSVSLYTFDQLGKEMDSADSSNALSLLTGLAGASDKLKVLETVDLDKLKGKISGLGGAMSLYAAGAKEMTGLEIGEVPDVEGAVSILSAISTSLVDNGGFVIPDIPDKTELSGFGADLAALALAVTQFSNACNGLETQATDKAIELLTFLGGDLRQKLTTQNLVSTLAFKAAGVDVVTLANFGFEISALGVALKTFANSTKDMGDTKPALDALDFFANLKDKLTGTSIKEAVINAFTGVKPGDLTQFGKNIEQLGTALNQFQTSTDFETGSDSRFQNALDALEVFASLKTKLPKVGGLTSLLIGDKQSFIDFATEVSQIGEGIRAFKENLLDEKGEAPIVDEHTMGEVERMLTSLVSWENMMPYAGGAISWVSGNRITFEKLATEMHSLAFGIIDFKNMITDTSVVPSEDEMRAVEAVVNGIVGFMQKLGSELNPVGGIVQWFNTIIHGRDYTLTDLKTDMTTLATGLNEFSSILVGDDAVMIDEQRMGDVCMVVDNIISFMTTLSKKLPKVGGLINIGNTFLHGRDYNLNDLATDLETLGSGIGRFNTGIGSDFNADAVASAAEAIEAISNMISILSTIGAGASYGMYRDIGQSIFELEQFFYAVTDQHQTFDTTTGEFKEMPPMVESFAKMMDELCASMQRYDNINPDSIALFAQMAEGLQTLATIDPNFNFEPIGEAIANGIANGIYNGQSTVIDAAVDTAVAAYEAACIELGIESPSKAFAELGNFMSLGMARGIIHSTPMVVKASEDMGKDALNEATDVIGLIGRMIGDDLNEEPTITPVLDLSNVNEGVDQMNRLLKDRTMSIDTSRAGAFAARYLPTNVSTETNQNGSDYSGLYARIEDASKRITELSEQIGNMKLVLNTGVIAGGVADGVDARIGRKSFYAGRNN